MGELVTYGIAQVLGSELVRVGEQDDVDEVAVAATWLSVVLFDHRCDFVGKVINDGVEAVGAYGEAWD